MLILVTLLGQFLFLLFSGDWINGASHKVDVKREGKLQQ